MVLDDVFPTATAEMLLRAFPAAQAMTGKKSLSEYRCISSRFEKHDPLFQEASCAFHDSRVLTKISRITGIENLLAHACISGLSRMDRGHFVNPHLDGSHDSDGNYQVMSVLYYMTKDLRLSDGGHLELWHYGPQADHTTILSKCNRLVVIASHQGSWHSVSQIRTNRSRFCIYSYYHAPQSVLGKQYVHPPTFRGRPDQRLRDLAVRTSTVAQRLLGAALAGQRVGRSGRQTT
jgi:Rps23 Pro-64 3,4-dihydroxylase Tpa1-like proline 4-hydroxylase